MSLFSSKIIYNQLKIYISFFSYKQLMLIRIAVYIYILRYVHTTERPICIVCVTLKKIEVLYTVGLSNCHGP